MGGYKWRGPGLCLLVVTHKDEDIGIVVLFCDIDEYVYTYI